MNSKIEEAEIQTPSDSALEISPNFYFNTSIRNVNYSVENNRFSSHINSFNNFSGNGNGNTIINLQEGDRVVFEDLENDIIKLKQRLNNLKDE